MEYNKRFTKYAKKVLSIKLNEFIQNMKLIFLVSNAKHHNVVKRITIKKQYDNIET